MLSMATMGSRIVIDATRKCLPLVVLTVMDPSLMYVNAVCIRVPVVCIPSVCGVHASVYGVYVSVSGVYICNRVQCACM